MTPLTILVADDDPLTVRVLAASLQKEGYQVVTAMDAMQAVRAAHKSAPAAIILDVKRPGGSGLHALKQIKSSNKTQLIPVLAMSSSDDSSLPAQMMTLGAEDFFAKPVDLQRLSNVLRRVLGGPPAPPA